MLQRCLFFFFLFFVSHTASAQRSETRQLQVFEGVLIGTVMAPSGNPVSGALVEALRVDAPQIVKGQRKVRSSGPPLVRTGRDGTFRVPLRFGQYIIRISAPGFLTAIYEDVSTLEDAVPVVLSKDNSEVVWPVVLKPVATLAGQVTDTETGKLVESGFVRIEAKGKRFQKRVAIKDGTYFLEGIPAGSFTLVAYVNGYLTGQSADSIVLEVGDALAGMDFVLDRGLALSGRVTDSAGVGLDQASVMVWPAEGEGRRQTARSDEDGQFVVTGLKEKAYMVSATVPGYARSFFEGTENEQDATAVEVAVSAEPKEVNFALKPVGAIFGQVTNRAGEPIARAQVLAESLTDGKRHQTRADDDGAYVLTGLSSADYRVWARAKGFAPLFYGDVLFSDAAKSLSVSADGHVTDINFSLGAASSIKGQITDRLGNPVAGARVRLLLDEVPKDLAAIAQILVPRSAGIRPVQTDGDGVYRFDAVLPGTYLLQVEAVGFASRFYVQDQEPQAIAVTMEEALSNLDVVLPRLGVVSGGVKSVDGSALLGVRVVATPIGVPEQAGRFARRFGGDVDEQTGTYRIMGLPAGEYLIRASAQHHIALWFGDTEDELKATPVTAVLDGQVEGIDFELTRGGIVGGVVLDDESGRPLANARVSVQRLGQSGIWQTATDGDGVFGMSGLPNGDFLVRAEAQGFVSEFYDDAKNPDEAKGLVVDAEHPITDLRISLAHRQPADFDGNGAIDFADLMALLQDLTQKKDGASTFDVNRDGQVDFLDFLAFVNAVLRAGKMTASQGAFALTQVDDRNSDLVLAVEADFSASVNGYVVRITYDPDEAEYAGVDTDSDGGKVLVSDTPGAIILAGDYGDEPSGAGRHMIAHIKFVPKNEKIVLTPEIGLAAGPEGHFMALQVPGQVRLELPPQAFRLMQNVPNPFNPATAIDFELPESADVELAIYNLVGQRVRTLVQEFRPAGRYQVEWDAKDDLGRDVSSGVYFYRFQAGDFGATRRMLLVR